MAIPAGLSLKGTYQMKTSGLFAASVKGNFVLLAFLTVACSAEPRSQSLAAEDQESILIKKSKDFDDCIIDRVLRGEAMTDSKSVCLTKANKSCDDAQELQNAKISKEVCLKMVAKATERVIEYGDSVDCDSGYCTILFK
jgi:hypothetical protein